MGQGQDHDCTAGFSALPDYEVFPKLPMPSM